MYKISAITNKYGPNTTVLLPGSCNAKCDFCFWNRDFAKIQVEETYLDNVFANLAKLDNRFKTLSISGGEPTLSPVLVPFLIRLAEKRRVSSIQRVVFTTHGGNLLNNIPLLACSVDHINISRHAISDEENFKIFKTKKIPTNLELKKLIQEIHKNSKMDVTLNCVIYPNVSIQFCEDFIKYAKDLGADAVSFRKIASDVIPTQTEIHFSNLYGVTAETSCSVCRGKTQLVNGFDVRWKGSVNEPSLVTNGVYEVIIHPDGNAYRDWGMKFPLELLSPPEVALKSIPRRIEHVYGGGCGGGGSGC